MLVNMFQFTVNAMVRGYHIYQDVWEVKIDRLVIAHDPYAITVGKDGIVL